MARWGLDLESKLNVVFSHVKRSANAVTDSLAKEGVGRQALVIDMAP